MVNRFSLYYRREIHARDENYREANEALIYRWIAYLLSFTFTFEDEMR